MKGGAHPSPFAALSFPNSKKVPIYCWIVSKSSHGEAQPQTHAIRRLCAPSPSRSNHSMDGWLTCNFMSFSTVFWSYQDNGQMIMKGCVQWRPVYSLTTLEQLQGHYFRRLIFQNFDGKKLKLTFLSLPCIKLSSILSLICTGISTSLRLKSHSPGVPIFMNRELFLCSLLTRHLNFTVSLHHTLMKSS